MVGGGGGGVKGPRADNMPRAPRNVNPALNIALRSLPFFSHFCITNGKLTSDSGVGAAISRL